jgi:hypothetical protein
VVEDQETPMETVAPSVRLKECQNYQKQVAAGSPCGMCMGDCNIDSDCVRFGVLPSLEIMTTSFLAARELA